MAQMFCTLKQAADRLETTEAEIEAMLNDGILREFRDGSHRLLKVADLAGLTVTAGAPAPEKRPACAQRKTRSTQPRHDVSLDMQIKLPSGSAAPRRRPCPPQPPTAQRRVPQAVGPRPAGSQHRGNPPRAVVISPAPPSQRPRPQTYEMSLRQWIWTGLIDDSPLAIFIVFGTLLLGACTLAGGAYLLLHAL